MRYIVITDCGKDPDIRLIDSGEEVLHAYEISGSAVSEGSQIAAIFEYGGISGFIRAYDKMNSRRSHRDRNVRLIYGTWLDLSSPEEGSVILVPHNQNGVTGIYRLITRAYSGFYDRKARKPHLPLSVIETCSEDIAVFRTEAGLADLEASDGVARISWQQIGMTPDALSLLAEESVNVRPAPKGRFWPDMSGAEKKLVRACYDRAYEIYGDPLPEPVEERLSDELRSITGNGFTMIYAVMQMLAERAREDSRIIGYRGAAGASLAAKLAGITDIDPLPPYYICPQCRHYEEQEDGQYYETCWELPRRKCPHCGAEMKRDGYRIAKETLMGFRGDREPAIYLNVAPDYRKTLLDLLEERFGKENLFLGGTGAGRKGYTACSHPGAVFIIPRGWDIEQFTPVHRAGNSPSADYLVTHMSTHGLDCSLFMIEILTHRCLAALEFLSKETGVDPSDIPLDDPAMMEMIRSDRSEGRIDDLPEFGTGFAGEMIRIAQPDTVAGMIRIDGLMHGTGTWSGNAELLIREGEAGLMDVVSCRDDIMHYLIRLGINEMSAFGIMEHARKGRELTQTQSDLMRSHGVPDWFIRDLGKIRYVFPRAHAVSYTVMMLRLAWFRTHYPDEYRAAAEIIAGSGQSMH